MTKEKAQRTPVIFRLSFKRTTILSVAVRISLPLTVGGSSTAHKTFAAAAINKERVRQRWRKLRERENMCRDIARALTLFLSSSLLLFETLLATWPYTESHELQDKNTWK